MPANVATPMTRTSANAPPPTAGNSHGMEDIGSGVGGVVGGASSVREQHSI